MLRRGGGENEEEKGGVLCKRARTAIEHEYENKRSGNAAVLEEKQEGIGDREEGMVTEEQQYK
jgi:hypothetical protein